MRPSWFRSLDLWMTTWDQQLWRHSQHWGGCKWGGLTGPQWMSLSLPFYYLSISVLSPQGTHQILPWREFSHESSPRSEELVARCLPQNSCVGASGLKQDSGPARELHHQSWHCSLEKHFPNFKNHFSKKPLEHKAVGNWTINSLETYVSSTKISIKIQFYLFLYIENYCEKDLSSYFMAYLMRLISFAP